MCLVAHRNFKDALVRIFYSVSTTHLHSILSSLAIGCVQAPMLCHGLHEVLFLTHKGKNSLWAPTCPHSLAHCIVAAGGAGATHTMAKTAIGLQLSGKIKKKMALRQLKIHVSRN